MLVSAEVVARSNTMPDKARGPALLVQHAGEVGVVVGVSGDLAVLVGDRGAPAACVIGEVGVREVRIRDLRQPVAQVVIKGGAIAERVHHGGAVAARVVLVMGDVALRVGDRLHQSGGVVGQFAQPSDPLFFEASSTALFICSRTGEMSYGLPFGSMYSEPLIPATIDLVRQYC